MMSSLLNLLTDFLTMRSRQVAKIELG